MVSKATCLSEGLPVYDLSSVSGLYGLDLYGFKVNRSQNICYGIIYLMILSP